MAVGLLCFATVLVAAGRIGGETFIDKYGFGVYVVTIALWLGAFYSTLLAFRSVFIRWGWMTREEATFFPLRTPHWPESWLERVDSTGEEGNSE